MSDLFFPGDDLSVDDVARAYVQELQEEPSEDHKALFWVGNLTLMGREEDAWLILLHAIELAPDDAILDRIGAGDLETLVRDRGDQFIDRIEQQARRSPKFVAALRGVWAHESPVRPRIDAILDALR